MVKRYFGFLPVVNDVRRKGRCRMIEPDAAQTTVILPAQPLDIHELQEEALGGLYVATGALGLALIVLNYAISMWQVGMLGMLLLLSAYPLYRLLTRCYLARAWLLVLLWLGSAAAAVSWLPGTPAPCLLTLPVALAAFYISARAGILTALATLVILGDARAGTAIKPVSLITTVGTVWGTLALIWVSLRPIYAGIQWSWSRYHEMRRHADLARDAQADLKQVVKDLAKANGQTTRLNQLLGAARRAAEEAERAKAEFVANVSHELRTPLNMIIGFSEMMVRSPRTYGRLPAALKADLAVILRNSQHLADLIDDVLDLSQIEAGQMALTKESVSMSEVVVAAVEAIQPLFASKGLYLTTEVPEGLMVFCDRTRIREVFLNLLSNAGRFTERGGVHVSVHSEDQEVVVSVADTGPGITPEDRSKLFQPFQQADGSIRRRYGGSGLGLSISKHFVEMHGGRMWLESEVGRGTIISFRLPLEPPVSTAGVFRRWLSSEWEYRQRTRQSPVPVYATRPRLIVVEKATLLQRLLRRYLDNVEIVPAGSLEEAWREMALQPAYALLVNHVSVWQTLDQIRRSTLLPYGTPVLVCTLPGEEEAAQSLGVAGYLVKPVSRETLLASLDRLHLASGTILIVDDEPEAIQLFWRMLTSSGRGYRILTADSVEQALSILHSERPHAILLDLVMPAMDGFQLLARRHTEPTWGNVPVIVMSARDPSGQLIIADAIGITRGGGLSVAQLLNYVNTLINIANETKEKR